MLAALGVDAALFDGVLGADFLGGVCKPEAAAFERVVAHTGCDPASTLFFEDSLKNLVASKALGMRTVLVGRATAEEEQGAAAGQEAVEEVDACVPELTLAAVLSSSAAALLFDE